MSTDPKYWQPRSPRKWDWGAGMFTRMCACELHERRPSIHSVDTSADAIAISRIATSDWPGLVTFHHMTSEAFLRTFDGSIDLLYMDTGETGDESAELHAREAAIVLSRGLLARRGIVLIDDVHVPGRTASKGARSIPLFCAHGFEVLIEDYQVVLQRPQ